MTGFNAHNDVFRALTRVQNILLRYGDRIPPVYVAVEHTGDIRLQFVASEAPEDWRRVAVDLLASHYCSDDPVHHPISRHYRAEGDQIVIYTRLTGGTCNWCGRRTDDVTNPDSPAYDAVAEFDANVAKGRKG